MRLWDPRTGRAIGALVGHAAGVSALALGSDGTWLASAGRDSTVRLWDLGARRCVTAFRVGYPLSSVVTSGRLVAVAGERGPYYLDLTVADH